MPRVRLDGGGRQFRRRWGYDSSPGGMGPGLGGGGSVNGGYALEDIEEDGDDYSDTYSLREEAYGVGVHLLNEEGKLQILHKLSISVVFFFFQRDPREGGHFH